MLGGLTKYIRIGGVRQRGDEGEEERWRQAGGSPTLDALRHRSGRVAEGEKRRAHEWARRKCIELPTEEEEKTDEKEADKKWSMVWDALRQRGMEDERVRGRNRIYGLLRNAHASKRRGVTFCILAVAASIASCWWKGEGSCGEGTYVAVVVNITVLGIWILQVTRRRVEEAEAAYTESIFKMDLSGGPRKA